MQGRHPCYGGTGLKQFSPTCENPWTARRALRYTVLPSSFSLRFTVHFVRIASRPFGFSLGPRCAMPPRRPSTFLALSWPLHPYCFASRIFNIARVDLGSSGGTLPVLLSCPLPAVTRDGLFAFSSCSPLILDLVIFGHQSRSRRFSSAGYSPLFPCDPGVSLLADDSPAPSWPYIRVFLSGFAVRRGRSVVMQKTPVIVMDHGVRLRGIFISITLVFDIIV